jgi:hypothetical protein
MDNFQEIFERLKKFIQTRSDSEIAKELEITLQELRTFKKKQELPSDILVRYCLKRKISIDWLLTGEEPFMLFNYWKETDHDGGRQYATNKGFMPQKEVETMLGIPSGTLEDWFDKQIAVIKVAQKFNLSIPEDRSRELLKRIIMEVEQHLESGDIVLSPAKRSELMIILYEDILRDPSKKEQLHDSIARLVRLAV